MKALFYRIFRNQTSGHLEFQDNQPFEKASVFAIYITKHAMINLLLLLNKS